MEIENDAAPNSAIEELVAGLNAATAPGTYAFIDTGKVGTDEIKVALIYKPARRHAGRRARRSSTPRSIRASSTRSTGRRSPRPSSATRPAPG